MTQPAQGRGPLVRRSFAFWAIALAVILFVSVNVLARNHMIGMRLDLTADRLFTLSPGTYRVIDQIEEPITLRFYFSSSLAKAMPGIATYASRVRDMLNEYAAHAGPRLRLIEIDPVPFSDAEDEAVMFGLHGLPLDRTGEQVYFGLAGTNATDEEEVIPFFAPDRERFLEYDLTRMLFRLANPDRPTVGLMSWLSVRGFEGTTMARMNPAMARPWQMIEQIEQLLDIQDVETGVDAIPEGIDVLLILHPAELSDRTAYAIDQFMLRGGRALIFVDPLAEIAQALPGAGGRFVSTESDLGPIFEAWGLSYDPGKVAGDLGAAQQVNAGTAARPVPVDFPAWMRLRADNIVGDDPVTSEIDNLLMASAGALSFNGQSDLTFTPLISTSPDSGMIEAEDLKGRPDFRLVAERFQPDGTPRTLVARLTGLAPSAFPDGPPPVSAYLDEDDAQAPGERALALAEGRREALAARHLARSESPLQAVILTDADMLRDGFWVRSQNLFGQTISVPVSDNMTLVTNALDNLTGSDELIGLRSRGVSHRPFTVVQDLQRRAEQTLRAKEQALQARYQETERNLARMQMLGREGEERTILSPREIEEIESFRAELLEIRRELRSVQLGLREDVEALEARLWFFNIGAIPLLVALAAIGLGLARMRRRRIRSETEARG